uniref:Adenylyl cyclase-associated protein n=1 Tax=Kalanchoe fedtschenkoi TaxID=63787 RepID=A0A7N0ZRQ3_KALFE
MEEQLVKRLETAVARLEALSAGGFGSGGGSAEVGGGLESDPAIRAFEDMKSECVGRVLAAAEKIGGEVLAVSEIVEEAFSVQKELLAQIKQCQKPDLARLGEFLKPLNEVIMKAGAMTEGKRSDFFNHLKSAADSLSALAWIAYAGKDCGMSLPIAHVEDSWQMAEFYNNKVLVEFKTKDPSHLEWAKAMKELYLPGLRDYVKTHYPLGPVWNSAGKTLASAPARSSAQKAPGPPPPPSGSHFSAGSSSASSSSSQPKAGMSAVFQEIGSKPLTSGLRKVTNDMKTKNRADRTGVVGTGEKEARASAASGQKTTGPPKLELQMGRKWVVENQTGNKNMVIDECDPKQSVYIYGCKDSVLQVQGKVNNITIDKCTKMGILFTDVVAACEVVNCNSIEVQCQGSAPTISVDNTAGCQLYLSKDSLEASITTAKSSEINVMVPGAEADSDWGEHALPQQFINVYKEGQFVTSPVSHSGA